MKTPNQNEILPWRLVIGHCSRRDFARHLKTLPKQYRRESVDRLVCIGYPLKVWPSLADKIDAIWNAPRIKYCTESSNVALCHAIDSVSLNRSCANSCLRLLKEVDYDREWNPHFWDTAATA
jgi:hypothetical protein